MVFSCVACKPLGSGILSCKTIIASGADSVLVVSPSKIIMRLKLRDQHVCETTLKRKIKSVSLHDFGKKQIPFFVEASFELLL